MLLKRLQSVQKQVVRALASRLLNQKDFRPLLEHLYIKFDKNDILRTTNLDLLPSYNNRRGGKVAYAEWSHVIGIFQTIIGQQLPTIPNDFKMLDVGCGTGILAIAAYPTLLNGGKYIGIDVQQGDIEFCKLHYPSDLYEFHHIDVRNASYAPSQRLEHTPWDFDDSSFDIVTALSVWTHFNQTDALYYFREINRILKPSGKVVLTAFVLDEDYDKSLQHRSYKLSKYHKTPSNKWIFDCATTSEYWRYPTWAKIPEAAIGITPEGLQQMLDGTDLSLDQMYPGNWREKFGLYFQDILIFSKDHGSNE